MSLPQLQTYTFVTKYARWSPELGRRETYEEAVNRVFEMHSRKYADKDVAADIEFARQAGLERLVLGSQRALQFGGVPIERVNARIYNCTVSYCDRPRFFQEALWLLLCGSGVGFSVQKHHVAKLPMVASPGGENVRFVIPDSIEGWGDALGVLLSSYFVDSQPFPEYAGKVVTLDYSLIRPQGAAISSGSGKAPGPEPLQRAIEKIRLLLDVMLADAGSPCAMTPIVCYDVLMHASDAVLAGGVRRSATICLFSPDDQAMITAKTGDWFVKNPQRGRSNNSAILLRSETKFEDFNALMTSVRQFGEPGFVWADSTEVLVNPCCVPGNTTVMTANGPTTVESLVGVPFNAIVNGEAHPSAGFFATGVKPVFEVTTTEGFSVRATGDHRFLVERDGDQVWVELSSVLPGEQLTLHKHTGLTWSGFGSADQGWLLGYWLGNGTTNENQALLDFWGDHAPAMLASTIERLHAAELSTKHTAGGAYLDKRRVGSTKLYALASDLDLTGKDMTPAIEQTSSAFQAAFIRGYFDADGGVQGIHAKGFSVRLTSVKLRNLQVIQRMLLRFGVYSKIYMNRCTAGARFLPDGHGGSKAYDCQAVHELVITRASIFTFSDRIGFSKPDKASSLAEVLASYKRGPFPSHFVGTVATITEGGAETVYDCTVPGPHAFDADGFYAHNCEIGMCPVDEVTGESGFQMCNLCEINMKLCTSVHQFARACKAAAILGTLQAGYTNFGYLGEVSERITRREALLGCSMTGIMDNPTLALDPDLQRDMAKLIVSENERMAAKLGINAAARTTCVKPAGTTSCVLGTSSGIHPHHAKRYFRRVQANQAEIPYRYFGVHNPLAVEKSVWSPNSDAVVTFCVTVPEEARTMNEVSAIDLLKIVRSTQENWVMPGKTLSRCTQPWLQHNVSNTVTVRDNEWDTVSRYIYDHRESFTGVSLLPMGGDLDYPQAPFCAVWTAEEILKEYGTGALFASGLIVDGLHAFGDLWSACSCALGTGETLDLEAYTAGQDLEKLRAGIKVLLAKRDWIRRCKQFAVRYYNGDLKRVTYLLKRTSLAKLWEDLQREGVPVDYRLMPEMTDTTKLSETQACAGGQCLI